jgi:HAMP domain-containing protein
VSWLHEAATWLIFALAAAMMLTMITAAILAGLVLRLAAELLRELGDGRQEDDAGTPRTYPSTSGE